MIDEKDVERLKEIFITREECHANISESNEKFSNDSVRLAVIESKLSQITWLLTAVAGGVITMMLKMFFGY